MTIQVVPSYTGIRELRKFSQQKYMIEGFIYSVMLHLLIIILYIIVTLFHTIERVHTIHQPGRVINPNILRCNFGFTPALKKIMEQKSSIGSAVVKDSGSGSGNGNDSVWVDGTGLNIPDEDTVIDLITDEPHPKIIKTVSPDYPLVAKEKKIEGTVWVKCYVDNLGKVRKAMIRKSDSKVLNKTTLKAASQFLFGPLKGDSGRAGIWMLLPFRFSLGR